MKNFKKSAMTLVCALLALSIFGLVGCSSSGGNSSDSKESSVNGTYTLVLSSEDCASELYLTGYMDRALACQTNTLKLEDGQYTLTKEVKEGEGAPASISGVFTFTGAYEASGNTVTLNPAADCEFNADWGAFTEYGCINGSGKASAGDMVNFYGDEKISPLDFFSTPFFFDSGNELETVTVDTETGSFTYQAS